MPTAGLALGSRAEPDVVTDPPTRRWASALIPRRDPVVIVHLAKAVAHLRASARASITCSSLRCSTSPSSYEIYFRTNLHASVVQTIVSVPKASFLSLRFATLASESGSCAHVAASTFSISLSEELSSWYITTAVVRCSHAAGAASSLR